MADPILARLLLGESTGRPTVPLLGATLTAWDPATYTNTVTVGDAVTYTDLPVLNPSAQQLGRVLLADTDAGPVILGPLYQAGG